MTESKAPSLSVRDLRKQYPGFTLGGLSFDLQPGMITGFIGRNGAGKTTTINAILSFIHKDGGEVLFEGKPLSDRAQSVRRKIGFVSAGMTYYTQKKLRVITGVTRSFYPEWSGETNDKYMRAFGLSDEKTPASLSNGMKIKYALTLALSRGAELFILDEPTSGLDPVSREELIEIFLRLRDEGKTVLFSTHIISDLEKCADRILLIQKGTLRADEAVDTFHRRWRIVETGEEIPEPLKRTAHGICRVKGGHTVLVAADEKAFAGREASLEEIMIHLEKEAETA